MNNTNLKKKIVTFYLLILFLTIGFTSFVSIDFLNYSGVSAEKVIIVDINGNGNYIRIQSAIDIANSGDTIYVWSGNYTENLEIIKKVRLIGNGSINTTIDGGNNGNVIEVRANNVWLEGFQIINSSPSSWNAGIRLFSVFNTTIINNNCSNNNIGIFLDDSNSNYILNNTCNSNLWYGIYSYYSNSNRFINNTCGLSKTYGGIRLDYCNNNLLVGNQNNNNNNAGIVLRYSHNNKVSKNICNLNINYSGMYLFNSEFNIIENNNLAWNLDGINSFYSNFNTIANNTCERIDKVSYIEDIILYSSKSNIILNNTFLNLGAIRIWGDELSHWNTHTIEHSNSIDGKPIYYFKDSNGAEIPPDAGQVILANCTNFRIENLNLIPGMAIQLGFSRNNVIKNNNLSYGAYSIYLFSSQNNIVSNNTCYKNGMCGIWLRNSDLNIINNNICSKSDFKDNIGIGILLEKSDSNQIKNNSCIYNKDYGIHLNNSEENIILNNSIYNNNVTGILVNNSANNNIIINNHISSNKLYGLHILNSNESNIYYNAFLNNSIQGFIEGNSNYNLWDNGNGEGNYWSDYTGLDNGAGGRIAGDGIGDTEIPHLGQDNYPFVNYSGWLYPAIPRLNDPGAFDSDGNYSITWPQNRGTDKCILEEDEDGFFSSPTIIYQGMNLSFSVRARENGTYYYRLKAFSEFYESPWSNIVSITVDWPPNIPQDLTLAVYPGGNTLNISWSPNTVDTAEYHLYYKNNTLGDWIRRKIINHPQHTFNDTNLVDGQEYYYKLQAKDTRWQFSNFTDVVSTIPLDTVAPASPTGLSVVEITNKSIKLTWDSNPESDLEGYFIYRSTLSEPDTWDEPIGLSLKGTEEYLDQDLEEITTYYYVIVAFDEVPNNSSFSNIINATTKLDSHSPVINNSIADFDMLEDTIDNITIDLKYWFTDINNDPLTFRCKGNLYIDVIINEKDGSVILIPAKDWCGPETITFYCSDDEFEISDNVTITVLPVNDPPETPEIISPINGLNITEGKKLTFEARCNDPDLLYGDILTFTWSSDISGELGTGSVLKDMKLKAGEHEIILNVRDSYGNFSTATIKIRVLKGTVPVSFNYNIFLVIFIIVIIIVLFVLLLKKRADKLRKEELKDMGLKGPAPITSPLGLGPSPKQSNSKIHLYRESTALQLDTTPTSQPTQEVLPTPKIPSPPKYQILEPQLKLIGRDTELNILLDHLTKAIGGQGSTIFISGEAGIGKTRLLNELIQFAGARGFQILTSNCAYESLTPFLPIKEALRSSDLDHLFAEEAPRVEAVYLVSRNGLLIKEVIRKETRLNPDIFSSMLTTVGNFVRESLSILSGEKRKGFLNTLGFENYRILIESGKNVNLVVLITGHENEFLINDMREIFLKVGKNYEDIIETWDGDEEKVKGVEPILQPLIASGKYDCVYYGESDPKARRNILFENVSMGLVRETQKTPILMCVEDLQWSDPSSLALIHHISKNSSTYGLVVIGTYRPDEITIKDDVRHPLTDIMELLDREGFFFRMELPRLPKECIGEILTSMFGGAEISDDVGDLIYCETEGNPLFIIELIKYLVEEGMITNDAGFWKLAMKVEELNIPPKIYQVILRRMSRLDRKYRELLDYASVMGETFSSMVLSEALKIQRFELLKQLRDLEQKYKVILSVNGNYRFVHAKIKEVIYSEIPPELRMSYHSIIANSIETLNKGNLDKVLERLAFHYYQCKNKAKAQFYLLLAAKKARNNYSNKESIRFYSEALEMEEAPLKRIDLFNSLGEIYDSIGEYDKSLGVFNSALELTKEPKMMADIRAKFGIIYLKKGDYDSSITQSTLALDMVKDKNSKEEALGLETIGYVYHRKGEYDKAFKHHKKSLEIREKLNDLKGRATSLKNIGMVLLDKREYDNALKYYNKSLAIFEDLDDIQGMQLCLNDIAALNFQKGEYERAFENYEKSYSLIEKIGDQSSIAILLLNIGQSLMLIGESDKALNNLEKSLKISKDNDLHIVTACNYWVMAEIYIKKRELRKALQYCNLAFEISTELGNKEITAALRRVFGIIYKEQRRWDLSIENFDESVKIYREIGNDKELGDSYYEFGLMWKARGDVNRAKEDLKEAIDIFKKLKLGKHLDKVKTVLKSL